MTSNGVEAQRDADGAFSAIGATRVSTSRWAAVDRRLGMRTTLLLIAALALSKGCSAECDFPREVGIPANWLLEYRGVADTVRYTDGSVFLEWDDTSKRLLICGDPYPVPDDTEYADEEWMSVPRYAELREQGKPSNEAGRIYEEERKALLRQAAEGFRRRLVHHFSSDMDPEETAEAIERISLEEKEEALAYAAEILLSHPFVEGTGPIMHLNPAASRITVRFHGRPPTQVRLDLRGRYAREEYSLRLACELVRLLEALEMGASGVVILQGGGRRVMRGAKAAAYRTLVR
jgi:hypothetical protein